MQKIINIKNRYKNIDLKKILEFIPQDLIDIKDQLNLEEDEKDYAQFTDDLNHNKCFICGCNMDSIDENNPCLHWFAHNSIKKKLFDKYLSKPLSYFRLSNYLKWLANSENPFVNINDLDNDISSTCILESTIKYKNFEWSFSLGKTDYEGHNSSNHSAYPHYHMQVERGNRPFINFNDYHIQFTRDDIFQLEALQQGAMELNSDINPSSGLVAFENENLQEDLLSAMTLSSNNVENHFHLCSIIQANKKPIKGELIMEAIIKSKETKIPAQLVLKELLKNTDAIVNTSINVDNKLEKQKRSGKK